MKLRYLFIITMSKLPKFEFCKNSTCTTNKRGYYYFFLKSYVGISLMIGGIPLKMCAHKTRAVINRGYQLRAYGMY